MSTDTTTAVRERFRALHADDFFVMPNPWDVGSARTLAALGFPALATTSSGHAATLGRADQQVTRDELLAHA
ncbi:MAG TPA: isocitrate lyase/phosphoenolpyruvate mutase family protein, partial [Pseudonocardia sp.]|nr:isocitrate lyase/phosphoenolpyruvate mutase family protein [Pseudonocardia sp.]